MKPVARKGDLHRCTIPGHGTTEIVTGSPSQIEGQPVAGWVIKPAAAPPLLKALAIPATIVSPQPTWAAKPIMVARLLPRRAVLGGVVAFGLEG